MFVGVQPLLLECQPSLLRFKQNLNFRSEKFSWLKVQKLNAVWDWKKMVKVQEFPEGTSHLEEFVSTFLIITDAGFSPS